MKKLLLIGGGHAHVEVLRQIGAAWLDAAVTLVSPEHLMPYTGMLPGLVAGHYTHQQSHLDLPRLARKAQARWVCDRVVALDPEDRVATLASGVELRFDIASIDVGSTPFLPDVPGLRDYALWAKPVEAFLDGWERVLILARSGGLSRMTVVGAGAGGVELMLAMQHRLRGELDAATYARCGISIVSDTERLLPGHPEAAARAVENLCAARDISLVRGSRVVAVERDCVVLANGARLVSDITVWVTGARPARWLTNSGLACDDAGFMLIGPTLQSANCPQVFGAGDCAGSLEHPRPKSGVYAVRQGPVLARNLRRALTGGALESHIPQGRALALLSLGGREALAMRGGFALTRPRKLLWHWKDAIDRRWMRRYQVG